MLKKLNPQFILIQCTFVFLFVTGLKRLYLSSQIEIFDAIVKGDFEKVETLTDLSIGEVAFNQHMWPLGFLGIAVLIIGLINWRYKTPIINSALVLIIVFSFFPLGLINGIYVPALFDSFCHLFSNDMETAYLIGGCILSGVSFAALWASIGLNGKIKQIKS